MPQGVRRNNKALSHLYKSSLPSLTELFPDWSQDDLIFVMDECQGDLHVAIARISEGIPRQVSMLFFSFFLTLSHLYRPCQPVGPSQVQETQTKETVRQTR